MSRLSGAHTHYGRGAETVAALAGVVLLAVIAEWILSVIVWIAIALGILLVLAAAVLVWWLRGRLARQAAWDARYAAAFAPLRERQTVTATVTPQVGPLAPPAIEQHVHYHYHAADSPEPARVIAAEVEP